MMIMAKDMARLPILATITILLVGLSNSQGNGQVRPNFSKHPGNTFLRSRGPKPRSNAQKSILPPPPPPPPRRKNKGDIKEERPLVEAEPRSFDDEVSTLQAPPLKPNKPSLRPNQGAGRVNQRPIPKLTHLRRPPVPPRLPRLTHHHNLRRPAVRPPLPPLPKRPIPGLRRPTLQQEPSPFLRPSGPLLLFDVDARQQLDQPEPTLGVPKVFQPNPTTTSLTHPTTQGHDHRGYDHHIHNDHQHGGPDLQEQQIQPTQKVLLTPDVSLDQPLTTAAPLPITVTEINNGLDRGHHEHGHGHHHKKDDHIDLNLLGPDFRINPRGHSSPVFGSKQPQNTLVSTTTSKNNLPLKDAASATQLNNLPRARESNHQPRSNSLFFSTPDGHQQPDDLSASDSQVNQRLVFDARKTKANRRDRTLNLDLVDNSVEGTRHDNRRIDDVTEMVDCGGRDLGFCDMNSRYPGHMMGNLMSDCQELVYKGFVPVPEDLEELGDNEPLARYSNASKSAVRAQRGSWSWKPYTYEKKQVCSSELRFIRPGYARDSTGKWQVIVQTEDLPQRVAIDLCHEPHKPCQMMSDCGLKSRCVQRYTFQHLLAVDPNNLHDCPTIRAFKFPAACVCHVEFADGQRNVF